MSKKYNQAGTSLIVDEIIELKGFKKTDSRVSKQQLQAELLKRDTTIIQGILSDISSDNKITPEEKTILEREWRSIVASNIIIQGIVDTKHMEEYIIVETYNIAYQSLDAFLTPLFVDMGSTSTVSPDELNNKFGNLYQARSIVEEMSFRLTTGILDGYDYREKFEVKITSSTGVTLLLDGSNSILSVTLLHNGEEVTADYPEDSFKWVRVSEDRPADGVWGERIGKTIEVNILDLVNKSATFMCKFKYLYSDTMYYAKVGAITTSMEVPGPPGEDSIIVQLYSSNGDAFRPGTANTTLTAYVFKGNDDITNTIDAAKFNWKRKSNAEPIEDERWNTSRKALGTKQILITPEDTIGRTVFSCEVDL